MYNPAPSKGNYFPNSLASIKFDYLNDRLLGPHEAYAARVALVSSLNLRASGLEDAYKLYPDPKIQSAIAQLQVNRQQIMSGELDDIMPGSWQRLSLGFAMPKCINNILDRLANETKLFSEFGRFVDIEELMTELSSAFKPRELFSKRSSPAHNCYEDVRYYLIVAAEQALQKTDFSVFAHPFLEQWLELLTPEPDPIVNSLTRISQIACGGLAISHGEFLLGALGILVINKAKDYFEIGRTPNLDLRLAYGNESYSHMAIEMGRNVSLSQILSQALDPVCQRASLIIRAMRLFGERLDYIDEQVSRSNYDRRSRCYPNLEESFSELKSDCGVSDENDLYKIVKGLHAVELLSGFEQKIKAIRIMNSVVAQELGLSDFC
jgi:hypothetical protein